MTVAVRTAPPQRIYATVPKLCPGGTVVCVASGPSLTKEDVDYCRDKADAVIVINTTYQLAPWATALYAADWIWWHWHKGVPSFGGLKYTLDRQATRWKGVQLLKKTGKIGLETDPSCLRTGRNSGYQAVNLAYHSGASRIVLLGYDMQTGYNGKEHWHPDHPVARHSPYKIFESFFHSLVSPLAEAGVSVVNCTRQTALTAFPRADLREVLR